MYTGFLKSILYSPAFNVYRIISMLVYLILYFVGVLCPTELKIVGTSNILDISKVLSKHRREFIYLHRLLLMESASAKIFTAASLMNSLMFSMTTPSWICEFLTYHRRSIAFAVRSDYVAPSNGSVCHL